MPKKLCPSELNPSEIYPDPLGRAKGAAITSSLADLDCDDSEVSIVNATIEHLTYAINGGSVITSNLCADDISFSGEEGDINLMDTDFAEFDLKMEECNLTLQSIYTQGSYRRNIKLKKGDVFIGNVLIGSEDISADDETVPGKITISVDNGKVVTKYGTEQLVIKEEKPETTAPETSEAAN